MADSGDRPIPGLGPRRITIDEYHDGTPEKLELLGGYISGGEYSEERRALLRLLLVNEGLIEAVKLAPPGLWREALERVYGREEP